MELVIPNEILKNKYLNIIIFFFEMYSDRGYIEKMSNLNTFCHLRNYRSKKPKIELMVAT